MLSFEYVQPAHYIRHQPDVCRSLPFDTIFEGSYHQPAFTRRVIARPRCQYQYRHAASSPRQFQRSQSISNFFNLLDVAPERSKPQVFTKVLESPNAYHIHIKKSDDSDDFKDYAISYKTIDGVTDVTVVSANDDFEKVYRFDKSSNIDIKNVHWKIIRSVLIVDVPKHKEQELLVRPTISVRPSTSTKPSHRSRHTHKRPSVSVSVSAPTESFEQTEKPRVVSIPIEFTHSSEDVSLGSSNSQQPSTDLEVVTTQEAPSTPSTTSSTPSSETELEISTRSSSPKLSRSNSDASLNDQPSPKLPKLTRKVSLEEVEDESLRDDSE